MGEESQGAGLLRYALYLVRRSVPKAAATMKKIGPGAYDDGQGGLHLNIAEMLADAGFEDTEENRRIMLEAVKDQLIVQLRAQSPQTIILFREPGDPQWKET